MFNIIPKHLQKKEFRFVLIHKGSKRPFEENWPETGNHPFNSPKLLKHLENGGNYGVVGGFGNLVIIDCDKKTIEKRVESILPKTFKVRTGRGGAHYYYICKDFKAPIRLTETVAGDVGDVQWKGKQVVGPGSIHENGNEYKVETNKEISEVTQEQIKLAVAPWISAEKEKEAEMVPQDNGLKITDLIDLGKLKKHGKEYYGSHPLHGSDSGMNFWVNSEKNCWHCFRHDSGGGPLSWIAVKEGVIDCSQSITGALRGKNYNKTFELAVKKYGMKEVIVRFDKEPVKEEKKAKVEEWEFENILHKEHFITKYIERGQSLSDAYPEYFFVGALNALSMIADRTIRIELSPKPHYTNLWTICIGKSTVSRKSTAINLNRDLLSSVGLSRQLPPDDATPEAFIDSLKDCARVNLLKDEFGFFLAKARMKYQSGIDALFSMLYDCPDRYERHLRKEKIKLKDVYISMLGALVPSQLCRLASMDDVLSGFFPRMLFVSPERRKQRKDLRQLNDDDQDREVELVLWLRNLETLVSAAREQKEVIHAVLTEDALGYYNEWCAGWEERILNEEDAFSAFFGRYSVIALKVAALFVFGNVALNKKVKEVSTFSNISILSNISNISKELYYELYEQGKITKITNNTFGETKQKFPLLLLIDKNAVEKAIFYLSNLFLPYAKKILVEIESESNDKALERIFNLAVKHSVNGCIEHSDLLRKANIKSREFGELVSTLQESGRFHISKTVTGKVVYTPLK